MKTLEHALSREKCNQVKLFYGFLCESSEFARIVICKRFMIVKRQQGRVVALYESKNWISFGLRDGKWDGTNVLAQLKFESLPAMKNDDAHKKSSRNFP